MATIDRESNSTDNANNLGRCFYYTAEEGLKEMRDVTHEKLKQLRNVENIDLSNCKITDEDLVHFAGVRIAFLCDCPNITDAGLSALAGVEIIDISGCRQITDDALEALGSSLKYILMNDCQKITDRGIRALTRIKFLQFHNCVHISYDCVCSFRNRGVRMDTIKA